MGGSVQVELREGARVSVGRSAGCGVTIDDHRVSREHLLSPYPGT